MVDFRRFRPVRLGFVPGAMTKVPAVPWVADAPVQNCELYNISEVEDLRSVKFFLFGSFKFFAHLSFQLFARVDLHKSFFNFTLNLRWFKIVV